MNLPTWMLAGMAAILLGGNPVSADTRDETRLYDGPAVNDWEDLEAYTSLAAADRIVGTDRRQAYLRNYEQLGINYGDAAELQLRQRQVILCPQTEEFLYSRFTPTRVRYERGARPRLERVVAEVTDGCETSRETALALMRFCRDLHKSDPEADFSRYVYGGTEEQMIDKPEILCETLGRLMVALCEIAGMPGRVVMHDLGGHIGSEILIDGQWGYIDPRCGMYFARPDGQLASVRELCRDLAIIHQQPDHVRADVSDQWSWKLRAWKCANMYFTPAEVNGFQNYSLADAASYTYDQLPQAEVLARGLMDVNAEYTRHARVALGLSEDGKSVRWDHARLRKIDIAYRHDGFSIFYKEPPMTQQVLEDRHINPLAGSNAGILVWGLGPGSVFCYETKVGQIFGEGLTDEQLAMLRIGDRWVNENVKGLIDGDTGPLAMAVERSHEVELKIFARLEMNHEYGPAADDNWLWVAFVGDLNKKHPEYRIGGRVLLDFKHQEVRDFKLAILREAAEAGVDGISMDFAVYPPFFEEPDAEVMTGFVRDIRAMLDEVGKQQDRTVELMVRVPSTESDELGLDWRTWMREALVDVMVPTHRHFSDHFDIRVEEFIALGLETGVSVYPTVWQALGFVDTDQRPSDEASGRRRYDKPKTQGMYFAQALMFHRAGADGIQLGMSEDQWRGKPWFNDLADPAKVLHADKHYMVDPIALRTGAFDLAADGERHPGEKTVGLRIGDDVSAATADGFTVDASVVVYCRPLEPGERLSIYVNGNGPVEFSGDDEDEKARTAGAAVDPKAGGDPNYRFEREWWKRGEHVLPVNAGWWRVEDNEITLLYTTAAADISPPLSITWIDVLLDYTPPE